MSRWVWSPSTRTAFKALLSARLCATIWSSISDCDETFNYWEPTHYLIHKSGFQTWEYSPAYALRSYTYLLLYAIPGWLYSHLLASSKIHTFFFVRCCLAFACASCESYFYRAVRERFGGSVARLTLVFQVFAPGMFISGVSFLPSTFSMYFTMLAIAAWLLKNPAASIICIAISTFVGWPFAGILGISVAFDIVVVQKKVAFFVKWCLLSLLCILIPLVQIDSYFFGKLVIAPLNIVLYNVFSSQGSELYGTEPLSFYFINGFLNFNFAFFAALAVILALALSQLILHPTIKGDNYSALVVVLPMYLWILVFFIQPHKEERFLFPIYPLLCLSGAIFVDLIEKFFVYTFSKWRAHTYILDIIFISLHITLGISRSLALYKGYHAPFDVYMEVNRMAQDPSFRPPNQSINLCVGKEWYRFPSSFFLPPDWHLQFIQSDFRGQLPKPYAGHRNATAVIPDHMNDGNVEEPSRYLDVKYCHYLVDLNVPLQTPREPNYSAEKGEWETLFSVKFLDSERSPSLFRAFYCPWFTETRCAFADYNLLKSKRWTRNVQPGRT